MAQEKKKSSIKVGIQKFGTFLSGMRSNNYGFCCRDQRTFKECQ